MMTCPKDWRVSKKLKIATGIEAAVNDKNVNVVTGSL